MFYVDSQRTVTRRESSLVVNKKTGHGHDMDFDVWSTLHGQSTVPLNSDSSASMSLNNRPRGSIRKDLIAMMFDAMLESIVESWETIAMKGEDSSRLDLGTKTASETTVTGGKKKKPTTKASRSKRSRSKLEFEPHIDCIKTIWWSGMDEKAVVRFKNGNLYEGDLSSKSMHGEGRFVWADGTVYLGQFKDNKINGNGTLQWKDDTWYQGEFADNLRHGKGLYVDSRTQRSYMGSWHFGTKHGDGAIYYSNNFKNSYDGNWIHNERFGYGSREYDESSGYKGHWDRNIRQGKGLMIWPNHDFYRGDWQNGIMSGYGIYIWEACYNNTMAVPSMNAFCGTWEKGQRHGYGILHLGLGLGSHYKGEFKKNKKHGVGKFVTNNGLILQDKNLFVDDNITPAVGAETRYMQDARRSLSIYPFGNEPHSFDICDNNVGLNYHVDEAFKNLDKRDEIRNSIIVEYMENNKILDRELSEILGNHETASEQAMRKEKIDTLIEFEETSLRNCLKCYETELLNIYYKYATICNTEEIGFTPVLIRLYLWQLYYDCNVHERGLTLVEIDRIYHQNPEWLARSAHNPFEKVYYWQFLHSLISVARRLYPKRKLPGGKPDTMIASAFRNFMEMDVIPGTSRQKGHLVNGFGHFVPLRATYDLYRSLGEPHSVRTFLRAVRRPPHSHHQPAIVEVPDICLPLGRNVYIFGDDLSFVVDDNDLPDLYGLPENVENLKLFNFGNLSSKTIIKIFAKIFPQLYEQNKIMNLDIELSFFEFFEAFVSCAEESIRVADEERKYKEMSMHNENLVPPGTPAGYGAKSK